MTCWTAVLRVHATTSYIMTWIIFSAILPFFFFGWDISIVWQKTICHIWCWHRRMVIIARIISADALQTILMIQILGDWIKVWWMHRRCHIQIIGWWWIRWCCIHWIEICVRGRYGGRIGNIVHDWSWWSYLKFTVLFFLHFTGEWTFLRHTWPILEFDWCCGGCACCSLRLDRHVDRKSRNWVLYRLVGRCGVVDDVWDNEFGDPLGGITNWSASEK